MASTVSPPSPDPVVATNPRPQPQLKTCAAEPQQSQDPSSSQILWGCRRIEGQRELAPLPPPWDPTITIITRVGRRMELGWIHLGIHRVQIQTQRWAEMRIHQQRYFSNKNCTHVQKISFYFDYILSLFIQEDLEVLPYIYKKNLYNI